jgi:cytochrome b
LHARTDDDRVYVWDAPTRVFHWLGAAAFATSWLTRGQDRYLDLHVFAGYVFFGLLVFRLVWGFCGGHYARFAEFGVSLMQGWRYLASALRRRAPRHLGHNPAGSWAVFLLLALGLVITVTGLATLGGEERQGPLSDWFGFDAAEPYHRWHDYATSAMAALVLAHVGGVILESRNHRENLVRAMISGWKRGTGTSSRSFRAVAGALFAFAAVGALLQFHGYAQATGERPYLPFRGPELPQNEAWSGECGGCHLAFHPSLLPRRSWTALLADPADHFGDALDLDAATLSTLAAFAASAAADEARTEAAWKIARSLRPDQVPRRITETPYWERKHREIDSALWDRDPVNSRANCAACHLDAEQGTFEDAAMRLPDPKSR